MRTLLALVLTLSALLAATTSAPAQDKSTQLSDQDIALVEKAFEAANTLMDQHKYAEALVRYKEALALAPDEPSILFNSGLAAYQSKNFITAADLWQRLKKIDPSDWRGRAKLIQAYQALGKLPERDAERAELLGMWKSGDNPELSKEVEYCRDQLEVNKFKVMALSTSNSRASGHCDMSSASLTRVGTMRTLEFLWVPTRPRMLSGVRPRIQNLNLVKGCFTSTGISREEDMQPMECLRQNLPLIRYAAGSYKSLKEKVSRYQARR